ncbi:hypothetical protein ACFX1S_040202 [Malus domestica]
MSLSTTLDQLSITQAFFSIQKSLHLIAISSESTSLASELLDSKLVVSNHIGVIHYHQSTTAEEPKRISLGLDRSLV